MAAKKPVFPITESEFLNSLLAAFEHKSKGIKHSVKEWEIEHSKDEENEEIAFNFKGFERRVTLLAWANKNMWLQVSRLGQGRYKSWEFIAMIWVDGRRKPPQEIVSACRKSFRGSESLEYLLEVWKEFDPVVDTET